MNDSREQSFQYESPTFRLVRYTIILFRSLSFSRSVLPCSSLIVLITFLACNESLFSLRLQLVVNNAEVPRTSAIVPYSFLEEININGSIQAHLLFVSLLLQNNIRNSKQVFCSSMCKKKPIEPNKSDNLYQFE